MSYDGIHDYDYDDSNSESDYSNMTIDIYDDDLDDSNMSNDQDDNNDDGDANTSPQSGDSDTEELPLSRDNASANQQSSESVNINIANPTDSTATNEKSLEQSNDSENCCIICTEAWTNSEEHHVVSLKCGHLFGKSCIETWLSPTRRTNRCPQCNKPAKKRDIHKIYARCLRPLDTWERDQALEKCTFWENKAKALEVELEKSEFKYQMLLKENDSLKLKFMDNMVPKNKPSTSSRQVSGGARGQFSLSHMHDFNILEGGCRLHYYSKIIEAFATTIQNPNQNSPIFPKNGIKKVPIESNGKSDQIFIHSMPIKDMIVNQYDGTITTVSHDKTIKITSLISKAVISSINVDFNPWSVFEFPSKPNLIYTGLGNGDVALFDKRKSNHFVLMLTSTTKTPVVSLSGIDYTRNGKQQSALFSVQLDTCSFYDFVDSKEPIQSDYRAIKLPFDGKFASSHYDTRSGLCLLSRRTSAKYPKMTHYVFDINADYAESSLFANIVTVLEGGNKSQHLSRSKLYSASAIEDSNCVLVCAGDESVNGALIWNSKSSYSQTVTTQQPVLDIELIENRHYASSSLLSCLSEGMIKLNKIC